MVRLRSIAIHKFIFQIFGSTLSTWLGAEKMAWHFSESSHGKGAPDGIGGAIKRSADALVAQGHDVADFKMLVSKLQESSTSINIIPIDAERIFVLKNEFKEIEGAETFKVTLNIHQVTWTKGENCLQARRLSCLSCDLDEKCVHYNIGKIPLLSSHNSMLFTILYLMLANCIIVYKYDFSLLPSFEMYKI